MSTPTRAVLICWDGAGWNLLNPLLDAGHLPRLTALIEQGVMGRLAAGGKDVPSLLAGASSTVSSSAIATSASIATTMVTGQPPALHGVKAGLESDIATGRQRPASSRLRRVPALWSWLDQAGFSTAIVDWPATHPAEHIRGTVVTDSFSLPVAPPGEAWPIAPESVHPEALATDLAELRFHPGELTGGDLMPFVPELERIDQERNSGLVHLAVPLASAISAQGIATSILEREAPDFLAIHFRLLAELCPAFLPVASDPLWSNVVPQACRLLDAMLGRIRELASDAHILLVSGRQFEPALTAGGLVCLSGPATPRDEWIEGATLVDIAPTALSLVGVEIPEKLTGRPLPGTPRAPAGPGAAQERPQPGIAFEPVNGLVIRKPHLGEWSAIRARIPEASQGIALEGLVAVDESAFTIEGAVVFHRMPDAMRGIRVHVVPERRRQGIASALLRSVFKLAHEWRATEASARTLPSDEPEAIGFLERHGFDKRQRLLRFEVDLVKAREDYLRKSGGQPAPPPPPEFRIVPLTEAPREELVKVLTDFLAVQPESNRVRLREVLLRPSPYSVALLEGERVVGVQVNDFSGELVHTYAWVVRPEYRRRGVGMMMTTDAIRRTILTGAKRWQFEIDDANRDVMAMVEKSPRELVSPIGEMTQWIRRLDQ